MNCPECGAEMNLIHGSRWICLNGLGEEDGVCGYYEDKERD